MTKINGAEQVTLATTAAAGVVKPDGTSVSVAPDGTISASLGAPVSNSNGTYRIISGLIEQWGVSAAAAGGSNSDSVSITFPIAFPTKVISFLVTPSRGGQPGGLTANPSDVTLTGANVSVFAPTGDVVSGSQVYFYAVGN